MLDGASKGHGAPAFILNIHILLGYLIGQSKYRQAKNNGAMQVS